MRSYTASGLLLAIGLLLVALFHSAPRYADPHWSRDVPQMNSEAFYRAQDLALSREARLLDLGVGLAGLGLSLGVAFALLRVKHLRDLRELETPRARWKLLALANLTWVAFAPVETHWLTFTLERGDYPWWADTIAIPMAGNMIVAIYGMPVVNAGLLACLFRARLPASLWLRPRGVWPWVSTVVLAALCVLVLAMIQDDVLCGYALQLPLLVSVLYLLLCGRAAAASARFRKDSGAARDFSGIEQSAPAPGT